VALETVRGESQAHVVDRRRALVVRSVTREAFGVESVEARASIIEVTALAMDQQVRACQREARPGMDIGIGARLERLRVVARGAFEPQPSLVDIGVAARAVVRGDPRLVEAELEVTRGAADGRVTAVQRERGGVVIEIRLLGVDPPAGGVMAR